jgi:hypothetical protein
MLFCSCKREIDPAIFDVVYTKIITTNITSWQSKKCRILHDEQEFPQDF